MSSSVILLAGAGIALGALLTLAGVAKLRAPGAARDAIDAYGLLPLRVVRVLATPLAVVETIAGLVVAWPATRAVGAVVVLLLLLAYTGAVASMLARGRAGAECGCGGIVGGVPIGTGLLARNLVLSLVALCLASVTVPPPTGVLAWACSLALGACGFLLCVGVDYLLARERLLADD